MPGNRPGDALPNGQNSFAGGSGGGGIGGGTPAVSIVNNVTGVIRGGAGGDGSNGLVNAGSPQAAAGAGGSGGIGIAISRGSILNFGQVFGGAAGDGADATVAGQVGGSDPFDVGGVGVNLNGVFFQSNTMSLDNRGAITGGAGAAAGASGAGAVGAAGGEGGEGVDAVAPVAGTLTIFNSGQIAGGNGGAGSAGTTDGADGAGGAGLRLRGNGLITTSGTISGGLSGDGITRANAITLLSGVHTLTLRTGASFVGNVVVDTAASSNPGVSASNTLNLDGASSGALALQQFHNFGHLTQTGGAGGTWTLSGTGAFSNDATVSAGTMVLDAASTLTVPTVNLLSGGTLSANGTLNSSVNVGSGATLMGTGTVGTTTVANGGALAPGNSIGTLNVAGNVSFAAGSTYRVEVDATGASDRLAATGTATLNGGTVAVLAAPGAYQPSTSYTILTAAGGITGAFAQVTSNLAFLAPTLVYGANNVLLTLTRNEVGFATIGGTFNQRSTGTAVQALGGGNAIFDATLVLDVASARAAFDLLSGEVHASISGMLLDDSRLSAMPPRTACAPRLAVPARRCR